MIRNNRTLLLYILSGVLLFAVGGCSKASNEIQTFRDVPIYPNAVLIENAEGRAVFLVELLSLSVFKGYYKNHMPSYGWKMVGEGPNISTWLKDGQEVIVTYSFPRSNSRSKKDGIINALHPESPPVLITFIFSDKD